MTSGQERLSATGREAVISESQYSTEGEDRRAAEESVVYVASQWQLMRWRFQRHKLAVVSMFVLAVLYFVAVFAEFIAPYDPLEFRRQLIYAPPQRIHIFDEAGFHWPPFVYGIERRRDPVSYKITYEVARDEKHSVGLFVHGYPYKLLGLFPTDIHLFGTENNSGPLFLLGTDRLGRDLFSRIIYGARISLSIGLVGVFTSLVLGILIGGLSGYYGGIVDTISQRFIEFLRSVPQIPLWMALSAAIPMSWPPLRIYFGITVVLSFIGWTGMARVVRGRFLSLREEDFVLAARLSGSSEMRIILHHMVPSFLSYIIASVTLAIPGMILGETSLSFLGVGLREPVVSWGVLLNDAQLLSNLVAAPWLLWPAVPVVVAVLCFNSLGDGLRDAADPYSR